MLILEEVGHLNFCYLFRLFSYIDHLAKSMQDKVADGLVATHLDDMIEIIIQGAGKGDHALVPPMVGKEMIMTHTGGAESAPCPAMAVVIVDERKSFSSQA